MIDRDELTQTIRWKIADCLAEERLPMINSNSKEYVFRETFYSKYGKRMIDIIVSLIMLIITSPINLAIGIITFFDVGFPLFFLQERVGKNGKTFRIIKFRNMYNTVDDHGELLPANERVTKWGRFVRRTSLDELLNFICVLKGDMSIIGPRPLVPQYLPRYSKKHLQRYCVKPGLECPPRNHCVELRTWNDQFDNDVWYVQNLNLKTDVRMIFSLIRFTFDRENAAARASAKRGDFMGYSKDGKAISLGEISEDDIEKIIENIRVSGDNMAKSI